MTESVNALPSGEGGTLLKALVSGLVFCYFFETLAIEIGFYLQAYMILSLVIVVCYLPVFRIRRLFSYERFLLLFYLYYECGTLLGADRVQAMRMFFGIAIFLGCYFAARFVFYEVGPDLIERVLAISGVVFLVASIALYGAGLTHFVAGDIPGAKEVSYGLMNDRGMPRMRGVAFNPDYFMMFVTPFLFLYLDKSRESRWYFGPFILALVCVCLTLSIAAYAAACAGLLTYLVLTRRFSLGIGLALLTGGLLALLLAKVPFIVDIIAVRTASIEAGSGRYDLWRLALALFREHSILGVGTNGMKFYTMREFGVVNVHSTFIEIAVESGVLGSLLYLFFVFRFALALIRKRRRIARFAFLAATLVCVFAVMFSVSATIHPAYLFALLLAYAYLAASVRPQASTYV